MSTPISSRNRKIGNVLLWTVQGLLAALFLFASYAKLAMPAQVLAQQSGLSAGFMRFIAVCEGLGALGLILPGIFRVRRGLTPLAASGLVIIMIGAVVTTVVRMGPAMAVMPFVVGVLLTIVIRGRRGWSAITLPRHLAHIDLRVPAGSTF